MKCIFHWNTDPCTPNECNFVYCEHNANRVFTVEEEARRKLKIQSSEQTPKEAEPLKTGISTRFRDQEGIMKCPYCEAETFNLSTFWCFGELIMFVLCTNCEKTVDRLVPDRTKIEDADGYKEAEGDG